MRSRNTVRRKGNVTTPIPGEAQSAWRAHEHGESIGSVRNNAGKHVESRRDTSAIGKAERGVTATGWKG